MKRIGLLATLFLLFGFLSAGQTETIRFQTGWENGQNMGFANRNEYPTRNVANWECQREVQPMAHNGLYVLSLQGTSQGDYAYCYCRAFDLGIPVENGMKISYWIMHPLMPSYGSVKIAVDGHFASGETIRDFTDSSGQRLKDQRGIPIHPALRGWYDNAQYTNTWYEVVVDLSPAAGKTLDYLMFAFDNGNDGFKGSYAALIDDVKIFVGDGGGPGCPHDSVASNRWKGEYFSNMSLGGSPVMVRDDGEGFLDFPWELGSPNASCVPVDQFSVRWTRVIPFNGGRYEFTPSVDDGLRLYIDGHLVREAWVDQGETAYPVTVDLAAGNHTVVFEYYENGGYATARLRWRQVDTGCPHDSVASNRWKGEYFSNMSLGGSPVMVRDDGEGFLDFPWELGSPNVSCVPVDQFSVRWTRVIPFNGGRYEFTPSVDDGFRLYVDGHLIREAWVDQGETAYPVTVDLAAGSHTVVFEYYENGGYATARLIWRQVDVPGCPHDSVASNRWKGEYFSNMSLGGSPVMVRDDGEGFLDFPWELGSPNASCIPVDRFSVRWTRVIPFNGGRYEFTPSVDDGFRLYIDGHLIREAWLDQGETAYPVTVDLAAGSHTVVLEYYENGGYATARLSWREVPGPQPQNVFYNDPLLIPTTPSDDAWFVYETKSVEQNRDEVALVIDPSNGAKAQAVREHLAQGKRVVLLVCGLGSWGTIPTGWERPITTYANDYLDAVVIRVNYGIGLIGFVYPLSFNKGVDHVTQLVLKARKAGSNQIRLYGHSEGSDVSAKVVAVMASPTNRQVHPRGLTGTWNGQGNPGWFEGGFGFGNPADVGLCTPTIPPLPPVCIGLTSAAAPPPYLTKFRGGFFRYTGEYKGNYYGNKYVLFNRRTDPANTGLGYSFFLIAGTMGTSAHDYRGVFSLPEFMAEYEAVLNPALRPANDSSFLWGDGAYVDRDAGERFDFVNVHWIPYIPGSQEMSQTTLTVTNNPPNGPPTSREVAHVQMKFYESNGGQIDERRFDLEENASQEITNPLGANATGTGVLFTDEQVGVVTRYNFEDGTRYFGAAYPSESYPSRTLYVPYLAKGWNYGRNGWRQTTELILFNPNSQRAQVEITYYNGTPGGAITSSRMVRTVLAYQTLRLRSTDLPPEWDSGDGTIASAMVHSDIPLSGMVRNLIGNVESSTGVVSTQYGESNYRIFSTRGSKKIFAPFLKVTSQDYESFLYVQNTSDQEVQFNVRLYGNGGSWDSIPGQTLPAFGMKAISLTDYVPSYFVGSAVFEVTSPSTGSLALVSQLVSVHGAEANEGIPDGTYWYQKRVDIVQLPAVLDQRLQSDAQWDAEINVINTGSTWDTATIKYYQPDGGQAYASPSKTLDPEFYVNFSANDLPNSVAPQLFNGSAVVEGGRDQKRLGAATEIRAVGKQNIQFHDILVGYSAWW